MRQEDSLFQLIKSLSKSEKRYFRVHVASGNEKYMLLFSALEGMERYDEAALRETLKGQKLLNQLHVSKNYLFELILRTLRSYASGQTVYVQVLNYLADYDNLKRIGLPALANKRLLKARELARKHDLLPFQIHATLEDRLFLLKSFRIAEGTARHREARIETEQLSRLLLYQSLNDRLIAALNGVTDDFDLSEIEAVMPRLKAEFESLSGTTIRSQLTFHTLCYNYHKLRGELGEALTYIEHTLELLKEHFYLVESGSYAYPMVLLDFFTLAYYSGFALRPALLERAAITEILTDLDRCATAAFSEEMRGMVSRARMYLRVLWLSFKGEYEEVLECFAGSWDELTSRLPDAVTVESELLSYRVRALFGLGEFGRALELLNTMMNDKRYAARLGLQSHLLSLIIHLELGNTGYIPFAMRSVRYHVERDEANNEYFQIALEAVRLLSRKILNRPALETLHNQAICLRESQRFPTYFLNFELDLWIESKLRGQPFKDIVRMYGHSRSQRSGVSD